MYQVDIMEDETVLEAQALLQKMEALLSEVNYFNEAYQARRAAATKLERRDIPDMMPGLTDFLVCIKGGRDPIQKIIDARTGGARPTEDEYNDKDMNVILNSYNSPTQSQWEAIKKSRGLLAIRRRFNLKNHLGSTVDAVVENGMKWLKVLAISEKRFVYQMAQEGWHPDDSEEDDEENDEESEIDLVKIAAHLSKAARINRSHTCIPSIHFFLPKINEGKDPNIDRILNKVRRMGVSKYGEGDVQIIVDCADSPFAQSPAPPLQEAFANLFLNTHLDRLTPTLNMELTLLISLVSDITHYKVVPEYWYSKQSISHIHDEEHAPGTRLQELYTALRGRDLECTEEIAHEFVKVVADIGTQSTKRRAELLLGRTLDGRILEETHLVSEFRRLSSHPTPDDLRLPIKVISKGEFSHDSIEPFIAAGKLPKEAHHICQKLDRSYNRTCYMYGWARNITTVSANSLTVRQVETTFDKYREPGTNGGPSMFLTPLALSLNTCRPCPDEKWLEIRDAKHLRKDAREKEAKQMKKSGIWGPSVGVRPL